MDWAYTGIAVLLALAAVYLVLRGDLLVTVVCIAASASVAAVEIDRALIGEETLRAGCDTEVECSGRFGPLVTRGLQQRPQLGASGERRQIAAEQRAGLRDPRPQRMTVHTESGRRRLSLGVVLEPGAQ